MYHSFLVNQSILTGSPYGNQTDLCHPEIKGKITLTYEKLNVKKLLQRARRSLVQKLIEMIVADYPTKGSPALC